MTFYNMKPFKKTVISACASTSTSASSFASGFYLVMIHTTKTVTLTCREKQAVDLSANFLSCFVFLLPPLCQRIFLCSSGPLGVAALSCYQ